MFSGRSLSERLMRPLLIELGAELIAAALLGRRGGRGRRTGTLGLERAMHALVAAVLLRLAGRDALRCDAELDPPDREPAKSAGSDRGERRTVVGAQRARQAIILKRPLQRVAAVRVVGPRHHLRA